MVLSISSQGQEKSSLPKNSINDSNTLPIEHEKLFKTQGSNQYANIHCSLMDHNGHLWFGTTGEGVYSYNGKYFTQFTLKDGLNSNTVWSILEDRAGNIWIGTDAGVCRYDGKNITRITINVADYKFYSANPVNNNPPSKNSVFSMLQDKNGKIWLGTADGIYCYSGKTFMRFLNDSIENRDNITLKSVQCMLEDKKGNIWFGSGPMAFEGLCKYDGKSISSYKPNGETWIRYIFEDKKGVIWLGTRHYGVWHYDGKNFTEFLDGNNIGFVSKDIGLSALQDKSGNIWLSGGEAENGYGGNGGIWRYDGKSFTNFTVKDGLGDYSVWTMLQDGNGDIWIGTRNNGLYRYNGKIFTSFSE